MARGEIADLCSWIPPEVAVITSLGPVHLERMGSIERIAEAKREIFDRARVGVISIDHPVLAAVAEEEARHRRMITVSTTGMAADVVGDPITGELVVDGRTVGRVDPADVVVSNVGCAIGAVAGAGIRRRWSRAPTREPAHPPHRQVVSTTDRGVTVIDDTFNANPAGAARALGLLEMAARQQAGARHSGDGRTRPRPGRGERSVRAEGGKGRRRHRYRRFHEPSGPRSRCQDLRSGVGTLRRHPG